ncbi:hypothetical protein CkaCkLH20_11324 [Colletotrichum karsti]|uniref:Secondary metabolism regulator LAE1 n=1 Tax=Colletotrichum karsti TaxID=1095194 RepID=A0A9P6LG16_9PEZI|nr:uncharacterized protein CkaCkLH20_11324 [Colletotrichum karsti]KAF9871155.1 hypothetical protein CkaCkLH20_11324 [Colletotrichum karsti]
MAHPQHNPEVVIAVDEEVRLTSEVTVSAFSAKIYGRLTMHDRKLEATNAHGNLKSLASSSTSLRSSLRDYREENGRTYHVYKDGKYNLPNDAREKDRLDLVHQTWLLTLDDRLGVAPPCKENSTVGRVLDVGTGTGIWAMNFGDEHPESEVYGNDLSAIMPGHVPPNVKFEVDDIEEEWTWSRPFEYIHSRLMTSSISDWPLYLRRCFDNLEPGGYLELQEMDLFPKSDDGTLKPESDFLKWANLLYESSVKFGRPYVQMSTIRNYMVEAGFEDVKMDVYKWPSNSWPRDTKFKELGIWNNEQVLEGLEGFTMAPLTRALEWTPAEVNVLLMNVRKDVNNRAIHAYWPIVPPNVKFEVDDIEEEWTFSRPFEYIHSRVMTSSIDDWSVYLRRCYDNLEPGGYLELQEIDIFAKSDDETLKTDSALNKWCNLIHDASEKLGRPFISVATLKALMIDAGFQDVTVTTLKWPTNGWPKDRTHKELGYWQNDNILAGAGIEALSLAPLTRAFDWSRAEIEVFLIDVRKDINNRAIHAYWPACCVVGRKPLEEDKQAEA